MYLGEKVYGNFRTKTKKPKSRAHRQDEGHLAFIRTLPCLTCRSDGACDPHHLLSVPGSRGTALKAEDWHTVPLCRACHNRLHAEAVADTELQWFGKRKVLWVHQLAERLWKLSGDYEAAVLIVEAHRA